MAVIKVTQKDLSMNKILDKQWLTAKLTKIETKRAASGKSNNWIFTFVLPEDCEAPGKEVGHLINDTRGFADMFPLFAAVRGISPTDISVGEELDTDELLNQKLDVQVIPDVYEGQKRQAISGFLPAGKGSNEVTF